MGKNSVVDEIVSVEDSRRRAKWKFDPLDPSTVGPVGTLGTVLEPSSSASLALVVARFAAQIEVEVPALVQVPSWQAGRHQD